MSTAAYRTIQYYTTCWRRSTVRKQGFQISRVRTTRNSTPTFDAIGIVATLPQQHTRIFCPVHPPALFARPWLGSPSALPRWASQTDSPPHSSSCRPCLLLPLCPAAFDTLILSLHPYWTSIHPSPYQHLPLALLSPTSKESPCVVTCAASVRSVSLVQFSNLCKEIHRFLRWAVPFPIPRIFPAKIMFLRPVCHKITT